MLKQIEALVEASTIVYDARVKTAGTSLIVYKKVDRIRDYLEAQIKEKLDELANS